MRQHRGRALRRRYGRATSHPLFPRLVMYLGRHDPTVGQFTIFGKLQRDYGAPWEVVGVHGFGSVKSAREARHRIANALAAEYGVAEDRVEFA
jgi:hypothetical protein